MGEGSYSGTAPESAWYSGEGGILLPNEGSGCFSLYYTSRFIIDKVNNYFSKRYVINEYFESYQNISLIFRYEEDVMQYDLYKKKPCSMCKNENCDCFCLNEGRFRRLEILNYSSPQIGVLDSFKDNTKIEEVAYDNKYGKIKLSSENHSESLIIDTKLIWVWCRNNLKQGEFNGGARIQYTERPYKKVVLDAAMGFVISEVLC